MGNYRTIKDLVIETCMSEGEFPSCERLTSLVLENFPQSRWKKTHYAWYKSKIKTGEISVPNFDQYSHEDFNIKQQTEDDIIETIDASVSLEKDLHSYLAARVDEIECGLVLTEGGIEFQTEAGRIDILAKDKHGRPVVEVVPVCWTVWRRS